MADITFTCPRCNQRLVVDAAGAGMMVSCPTCHGRLVVPEPKAVSTPEKTQRILPFEYPKASAGAEKT
ncbi:MAG TPA: hypothetical protein VL171_11315 [Verrucomicrobiae bacterium]|nr:hypothetical protein [Verrucomicrobiae bacterium]